MKTHQDVQQQLSELREFIHHRINRTSEFVNEPTPDWYNTHDFASGFYKGSKVYSKECVDFLKEVMDLIEKID